MSLPVYTRNVACNAAIPNNLSLHSAFPGTSGTANELSGGTPAYARKTVACLAAVGGSTTSVATTTFDVPSGSTVSWVGAWEAGTFMFAMPLGGATPKNFSAILSTDQIVSTAHGYADTQKIVFYDGVPPAPLVEGTTYYVRDSAADTFSVAATSGGAAINLTAGPSFGCVMNTITVNSYSAQDTQDISTLTVAVPT